MELLETASINCPYCGEPLQITVDRSAGDQDYIEDCQVCCQPIELRLRVSDGSWQLEGFRDDE
jgi:hypothetical protein